MSWRLLTSSLSMACGLLLCCGLEAADDTALSLETLREFVKSALDAEAIPIDPPEIARQDNTVTLKLGGLQRSYAGQRQLLDYPLEAMVSLELIRRDLVPKADSVVKVDWSAVFPAVDAIIEKELQLLNADSDQPGDTRQAMLSHRKAIDNVYSAAITQSPGTPQVTIGANKGAALHTVTIKLDPNTEQDKAIVFYLPKMQYELLAKAKGLDDDRNWREVATPTVRLGGQFYFRGRWAGNRTRTTGVIALNSDQEVTIRYVE